MYWKYWEVLFWFEEGEFWVKIGNGRFLEVDGWYYMEKLLVKRYCEWCERVDKIWIFFF